MVGRAKSRCLRSLVKRWYTRRLSGGLHALRISRGPPLSPGRRCWCRLHSWYPDPCLGFVLFFGGALAEAGFRSCVGPQGSNTQWMSSKWGDVFLHETAIAHIRRLLATRFACTRVDETWAQFRARMQAVEDYMNSDDFAASGGQGLHGLAKELHTRCQAVVQRKGARLPK